MLTLVDVVGSSYVGSRFLLVLCFILSLDGWSFGASNVLSHINSAATLFVLKHQKYCYVLIRVFNQRRLQLKRKEIFVT